MNRSNKKKKENRNNNKNNNNNNNNNRKNKRINIKVLEDQIIGEIYNVIDDIFVSITDDNLTNDNQGNMDINTSNPGERDNSNPTPSDTDITSNVTMDIDRNVPEQNYNSPSLDELSSNEITPTPVQSQMLSQDENVNLTGGSQIYPGSSISPNSHMSRINNHERQINQRLRQQRFQNMLNNRRNQARAANRRRNQQFNPLLTTNINQNRLPSMMSSTQRNINRPNIPVRPPRPSPVTNNPVQRPNGRSMSAQVQTTNTARAA